MQNVEAGISYSKVQEFKHSNYSTKQNATFVVLVRNSELKQIIYSIRQLEQRFNHLFNYPYVFLNDKEFSLEFKSQILETIPASRVEFGLIPTEHWSLPSWINQTLFQSRLKYFTDNNIMYGGSESYRHMCRFNSGFFYKHPLMLQYDYYWRIEPDVDFNCDLDYDLFAFMDHFGIKYGYTIIAYEFSKTVVGLWDSVMRYIDKENITFPNFLEAFGDTKAFNNAHFWSNFEIGDLRWFRSQEYNDFFNYLDNEGGFFYERWGDAPVHSIGVGLFLKPEQVHYFNDIGYRHGDRLNCPSVNNQIEQQLKCDCDLRKSVNYADRYERDHWRYTVIDFFKSFRKSKGYHLIDIDFEFE